LFRVKQVDMALPAVLEAFLVGGGALRYVPGDSIIAYGMMSASSVAFYRNEQSSDVHLQSRMFITFLEPPLSYVHFCELQKEKKEHCRRDSNPLLINRDYS